MLEAVGSLLTAARAARVLGRPCCTASCEVVLHSHRLMGVCRIQRHGMPQVSCHIPVFPRPLTEEPMEWLEIYGTNPSRVLKTLPLSLCRLARLLSPPPSFSLPPWFMSLSSLSSNQFAERGEPANPVPPPKPSVPSGPSVGLRLSGRHH